MDMKALKKRMKAIPPGLILIRYKNQGDLADVMAEFPPCLISDLRLLGYLFVTLPDNVALEALDDKTITEIYNKRFKKKELLETPPEHLN